MFIVNPTQDQLKKWYKCKKNVAKYLMNKIPVIYIEKEFYYFERTEEFTKLIADIPFKYKLLDVF